MKNFWAFSWSCPCPNYSHQFHKLVIGSFSHHFPELENIKFCLDVSHQPVSVLLKIGPIILNHFKEAKVPLYPSRIEDPRYCVT